MPGLKLSVLGQFFALLQNELDIYWPNKSVEAASRPVKNHYVFIAYRHNAISQWDVSLPRPSNEQELTRQCEQLPRQKGKFSNLVRERRLKFLHWFLQTLGRVRGDFIPFSSFKNFRTFGLGPSTAASATLGLPRNQEFKRRSDVRPLHLFPFVSVPCAVPLI